MPVTLITGGSRGIGRATVLRLAEAGHEVITVSRTSDNDLPAVCYRADLGDDVAASAVLESIVQRYQVDNLVNNAGAIGVSMIDDMSVDHFEHLVNVNLRALLLCIKAVTPSMKRNGRGRIVNLGSRAALGKVGRTVYGMTKAGVVGMSRSLAIELAPHGITVNVVSPGPIDTDMFWEKQKREDPRVQRLIGSIPTGRMGRPEEVAAAVAFFLGDDASFITGQNIYVCGGLSIASASM